MRLTLVLLIFAFCFKATAQTNEMEAKAAYQLAEESYQKNDYPSTLKLLESAKKNLGGANSKILYLQILTEAEMAKIKPELIPGVLKTIAEFQAAPDVKTFNEDKMLEVLKLKISLTAKNEDLAANAKKQADAIAKGKENFAAVAYKNWPVQVHYNVVKESNKDSVLLQKRLKDRFEKNIGLTLYYMPSISYSGNSVVPDNYAGHNIFGMLVKGDTIKGYRRVYYHADQQTGGTFQDASNFVTRYIQYTTNYFYKQAQYKPKGETANYDQYTWSEGNKTFTVYYLFSYIRPTFWTQTLVTEIRYN